MRYAPCRTIPLLLLLLSAVPVSAAGQQQGKGSSSADLGFGLVVDEAPLAPACDNTYLNIVPVRILFPFRVSQRGYVEPEICYARKSLSNYVHVGRTRVFGAGAGYLHLFTGHRSGCLFWSVRLRADRYLNRRDARPNIEDVGSIRVECTEYTLAAGLGAEYLPVPKFGVGIEVQLCYSRLQGSGRSFNSPIRYEEDLGRGHASFRVHIPIRLYP